MLVDLHVHTRFSACSRLGVGDILRLAAERGVDGVCLTDHETGRAARRLWSGRAPGGLVVVVGRECATAQGDFLVFGAPGLPPGLSASRLLDAVARAGGVAVAAHPCRPGRSTDPAVLGHSAVVALETLNGRNPPEADRQAAALAAELGLPGVGGSDAHTDSEVASVVTCFEDAFHDEAGLVAALRSGRARAAVPQAAGADRARQILAAG